MKPVARDFVVGSILILLIFGGVLKYALSVGPKMESDSKQVANEFCIRSQARSYDTAHQLLSRSLQERISVQSLKQQWSAFEQVHGPIRNWRYHDGFISMGWPQYIDAIYEVIGRKSGRGAVSVRLVREDGTWRIDRLSIRP